MSLPTAMVKIYTLLVGNVPNLTVIVKVKSALDSFTSLEFSF